MSHTYSKCFEFVDKLINCALDWDETSVLYRRDLKRTAHVLDKNQILMAKSHNLALEDPQTVATSMDRKGTNAQALTEKLKFTVASWMLVLPHFHGFSIDQIMLN